MHLTEVCHAAIFFALLLTSELDALCGENVHPYSRRNGRASKDELERKSEQSEKRERVQLLCRFHHTKKHRRRFALRQYSSPCCLRASSTHSTARMCTRIRAGTEERTKMSWKERENRTKSASEFNSYVRFTTRKNTAISGVCVVEQVSS